MDVVFFGTPDFAVPTLRRLADSRHRLVRVVTKPDRPVGRQREMQSPPVAMLARELGMEVVQPGKLKGADRQVFGGGRPDVAVVVAYGKLIPASMLDVPRHGFVNLHPSLLPRHRGPSPIQWTLVCGDRTTGVTTIQLDEGMDTGPILLQERVGVAPGETADLLSERLARLGADLVVSTLDGLEEGRIEPTPQPPDGANVTPMLRRSFAKVDWSMPARNLVNRLRGFTPWPGLYTRLRGGRIKLHGLQEVPSAPEGDEEPGTILATSPDGVLVRCGRGTAVRVTELQREGRRRMPVDAFLIGERLTRGEKFG